MKIKYGILISVFVMVSLLTASCGGAASEGGSSAATAEATTEAVTGNNPPSASNSDLVLDPANSTATEAVRYLYEGLVRVQDGTVTGELAESYTVSEDGLDYIFNLRPDVKFHDGTALTADIVVSNFNRWFDPNDSNRGSGEFAAWAKNFGGFKAEVTEEGKAKSTYDGIEKVNDLTVLIHLNTTDADFLTKLSDPAFSIVNPNSFTAGDGGTGAYKFSSLNGSTATLEPFTDYWDAAAVPTANVEVAIK
jgi:peptide/nickel transport system substrate-binding protein